MTSLRLPGLLAFLLLIYITADLRDPFIPGVFSFEKDDLFVDGVVHLKSHASTDLDLGRHLKSGQTSTAQNRP